MSLKVPHTTPATATIGARNGYTRNERGLISVQSRADGARIRVRPPGVVASCADRGVRLERPNAHLQGR